VAQYAAARCDALEIWLGKLERYLENHALSDAARLLEEHALSAPVAAYQGGLFDLRPESRDLHWEGYRQRLDLCGPLGVKTLLVAADMPSPVGEQDVSRMIEVLSRAAELAGRHDVRLALEFQARGTIPNNLETAMAMIQQVGSPHLGVCLDAFHFFTGPSKTEDFQLLTTDTLFHVQLCDVADRPRELASDGDRILPGDGQFPLERLVTHLHLIDYDGHVSVELMNPQLWHVAPVSFAEVAMTALRKVLGLACPS
jgi:4-hydroxyphenylpyruvate dioxygenase